MRRWRACLLSGVVCGVLAASPTGAMGASLGAASHDVSPTTASVELLGGHGHGKAGDPWKPDKDLGSFYMVTKTTDAQDVWGRSDNRGIKLTGRGIGVALIDSGVTPVEGLARSGQVVNGPDLSFESGDPELRHLDAFGHGTHMAGIIAGRDPDTPPGNENNSDYHVGMAPDARIVNLKVASADGSTDVSQVIAAIDWAVQHRNDPALNIRVLSLSFGTQALQPRQVDPLAHAVEVAWRSGIVVVVAAGNEGALGTTLTNPAINPYVIAVGAVDHNGTEKTDDDRVATFSSVGGAPRRPDVLAPGRSIVSYRVPGSFLDQAYPTAVVEDEDGEARFFRGSGTSQATAVVAGAVALMLDERPLLTPDQVKYALMNRAERVGGSTVRQLQLKDIQKVSTSRAPVQNHGRSTGIGSLELARGGSHVADPDTGEELIGEQDIFGRTWDGTTWAAKSLARQSWRGGTWNGSTWTGDGWAGQSWRSVDWSGTSWTGQSWRTGTWSGMSWRGQSWRGQSWRGATWAGMSWRGNSWRSGTWSGVVWR